MAGRNGQGSTWKQPGGWHEPEAIEGTTEETAAAGIAGGPGRAHRGASESPRDDGGGARGEGGNRRRDNYQDRGGQSRSEVDDVGCDRGGIRDGDAF